LNRAITDDDAGIQRPRKAGDTSIARISRVWRGSPSFVSVEEGALTSHDGLQSYSTVRLDQLPKLMSIGNQLECGGLRGQ
jgi:hypothetical protein